MRKTGLVIRLTRLLVFILLFVSILCFAAYSEHEPWNCPECGRTGNTGNYCGGCAHPAPWLEAEEDNSTDIPRDFSAVGNIVTFGHYEQDNDTSNGAEEIEWIVLDYDKENHKTLLLSKYGLDAKPYNKEYTSVTWETCTLRTWLNQDFLKRAFSEGEQDAILLTTVDNSNVQGSTQWNSSGGNDTQDHIFLLNYKEKQEYLYEPYTWVEPTAYAIKEGAQIYTYGGFKTPDGKDAGWWWLRSPGKFQNAAALVTFNGDLVDWSYVGVVTWCVRPALWLNLESDIFQLEINN